MPLFSDVEGNRSSGYLPRIYGHNAYTPLIGRALKAFPPRFFVVSCFSGPIESVSFELRKRRKAVAMARFPPPLSPASMMRFESILSLRALRRAHHTEDTQSFNPPG